jgi:hypothetical protein
MPSGPFFARDSKEIFCSLKILDRQGKMRLYYQTILNMYRMFKMFIENDKKNLTKVIALFTIYANRNMFFVKKKLIHSYRYH